MLTPSPPTPEPTIAYWTYNTAIEGGSSSHQAKARTLPTPNRPPSNHPVLVGAGDISSCAQDNDAATAKLVNGVITSATGQVGVFTVGDNAYESGTDEEFEHCYGPTWGQFKDRTRPAPGNHEYKSGNAGGYFNYFGAAAGDPAQGYYSYDLGTWHIVVLNTNDHCRQVACDVGSPQEQWLRADLAAHPANCTLAIWHDPLFYLGHNARERALGEALLGRSLRARSGCGHERSRAQLRTVRAANAGGSAGPPVRDPRIRCGDRRGESLR